MLSEIYDEFLVSCLKKHKMKKLIISFLLFNTYFLNAQDFKQTNIISFENDTLEVMLNDDFSKEKSFRVLTIQAHESIDIDVKKIKAYYYDSLVFEKKEFERPMQLFGQMQGYMQLVYDGKVKMYRFDYLIQSASSSKKMSNTYVQSDFYLQKEGDKKPMLVRKGGFRKSMKLYFQDCPLMVEQIELKRLKYRDLPILIQFYNEYCE